MKQLFRFCSLLLLLVAVSGLRAQTAVKITGSVRDTNGAGVAGAVVQFISVGPPKIFVKTATDESGHFIVDLATSEKAQLIVEAPGFHTYERQCCAELADTQIVIVLSPKPVSAEVSITRAESRIEDNPASIVVIDSSDLSSGGAQTLDDKLRRVPGFSLFRRAGSSTANPTTQGVSLRGVGASGASRALVLRDGVPLNDPFGGWIYWGRVPLESIAEVEILRGPASDLYGSSAIGGVISITKRRPAGTGLSAELSYGTMNTFAGSGFLFGRVGNWAGSAGAEAFDTRGFVTVDEGERGSVDVPANVRRAVVDPEISYDLGNRGRIFASAALYRETRGNGTPLQSNDTRIWNFSAGADWMRGGFGALAARAYGGTQLYHQSFSAVAADRSTETLLRRQTVPAQALGGSVVWNANFRKQLSVFAGAEARAIRGVSDETVFSNSQPSSYVSAGGRELTLAGFGGGVIQVASRLSLSGGLRFDSWRNFSASSATRSVATGQVNSTVFPERSESAVSPRAALLFKFAENVSATASFATGFRQPTLNELYRSFRVGNVLTLANEMLRAERALNGEAGIIANFFDGRLFSRGNFFCTGISRPVANVTLNATPALITRQRQNLGRTRSCGLELDAAFTPFANIKFSAGYLFVDSRVVRFPANVSLENLRIPQVAPHQYSFQVLYSKGRITNAGLQVRGSDKQFDDDQNRLTLKRYLTADGLLSFRLTSRLSVFAAVENIFDSDIESGRTPVLTLAAPRAARIGLRLELGKN